MGNTTCNSFYDKDEPTVITVVIDNSKITGDQTDNAGDTKPATEAKKKKSILWIWAASAFAALLLSPDENANNIDKPAT